MPNAGDAAQTLGVQRHGPSARGVQGTEGPGQEAPQDAPEAGFRGPRGIVEGKPSFLTAKRTLEDDVFARGWKPVCSFSVSLSCRVVAEQWAHRGTERLSDPCGVTPPAGEASGL